MFMDYIKYIILATIIQRCQCEYIYEKVGDSAYFIGIGESYEGIFDWFDARRSCWDNYGELVSVVTSDQMQQLQNYIVSNGYGNGSTFSTSGHSYDDRYPFRWDALDQEIIYTKWLPGEEPPPECNLSLQLIDSELYMIQSWGHDQYYICEYLNPWRRFCAYIYELKIHLLMIAFLVLCVILLGIRKKRIPHNTLIGDVEKVLI